MDRITYDGNNINEVMDFFGTEKSALIATDTHDICGFAVMKGDSFRKAGSTIQRCDETQISGITYTGTNTVDLIEFIDRGGKTEPIDCMKSVVFYRNGNYLLEVKIGDTVLWDGRRFDIKPWAKNTSPG